MANEVWIVVPARAGSKGIREKNLSIVGGKPLIVRSLESAIAINPSRMPILSSDSLEYAEIASKYLSGSKSPESIPTSGEASGLQDWGRFFFHLRSAETSSDEAGIPSVLRELGETVVRAVGVEADAWLVLQPTSPFRSAEDVENWRKELELATSESSSFSVTGVGDSHPARMYLAGDTTLKSAGFFPGLESTRRQDLPEVFIRDGGFYLIGRELVDKGLQFTHNPKGLVREFPWSINIDSISDLWLARSVNENLN